MDKILSRYKVRPGWKKNVFKEGIKVRHGSPQLALLHCSLGEKCSLCFRHWSLPRTRGSASWRTPRFQTCSSDPGPPEASWTLCALFCRFCVLYSARETVASKLPAKIPLLFPSVFFFFRGWSVSMRCFNICVILRQEFLAFPSSCGVSVSVTTIHLARFRSRLVFSLRVRVRVCVCELTGCWRRGARSLLLYPWRGMAHSYFLAPPSPTYDCTPEILPPPHSQVSPLQSFCAHALNPRGKNFKKPVRPRACAITVYRLVYYILQNTSATVHLANTSRRL